MENVCKGGHASQFYIPALTRGLTANVQQRKRPVTKQDKGKNLASARAMHDQCILRSMCSIAFYAGSEEVIKYSEAHGWEKNTDECYVTGQPEKILY